jgi:raffinose/stachyose/melibiose transport system substrate-binding protein
MLDMKGARCFEPSPERVTAAAAYAAFNAGRAAMMLTGTGDAVLNVRSVNPSLNLGFFPVPGASPKNTRVLVNPLVNLAVNAASPVKQAAVTFLDYIGRAWQSVAIANTEDSISSLDLAKGVGPADLPLFASLFKARQTAVAPLAWANNTTGVAVWRAGITALLAGTKTIDQVLTETDAAW